MSNVIGFPHGFQGSDNGPVDPPCECEDGYGAEGYKTKHLEPTSSVTYPFARVVHTAEGCWIRFQMAQDRFVDVPATKNELLNMQQELAKYLSRVCRD